MNTMRCSIDKNHEFCTTYEANKEDAAKAFGEWDRFIRTYLDGRSISAKRWKYPILYVNDVAWMIVHPNGSLGEPTQKQIDDIRQYYILTRSNPNTMANAESMAAHYKQHKAQLEPYFTTIAR